MNFGISSLLVMGFKNIHWNLDGFTCMTFNKNHFIALSVSCFSAANTSSIVLAMIVYCYQHNLLDHISQ